MKNRDKEDLTALQLRLRKIIGQLNGVQKMLEFTRLHGYESCCIGLFCTNLADGLFIAAHFHIL